jgi:hypothetical protein
MQHSHRKRLLLALLHRDAVERRIALDRQRRGVIEARQTQVGEVAWLHKDALSITCACTPTQLTYAPENLM